MARKKKFDLDPHIPGKIYVGSSKRENVIWIGRMAERRSSEQILFDGSGNFVVLEVGKRGSGKSYGMGSMLEGFAVASSDSPIGKHVDRRGVLLLDPLDIHWTALETLRPDGPSGLAEQYAVLNDWDGLEPEPINVQVFIPAGYEWDLDHPRFQSYRLPVSDLDAADWAHLLDCDLVSEPRGRLVDELYRRVTELGWQRSGRYVQPKKQYSVDDLIECAEHDDDIEDFYQSGTIRSVVQPLRAFGRMPLFDSPSGTPLNTLVQEGVLSIMCLGRLPADVRTVLATVMVRKLRYDRMHASQIRRRLALETLGENEERVLREELKHRIPRTILAIDEAQILMPTSGSAATRKELDAFVLEGRNYGLSLWMATQRPKGAISNAAISQIDTFFVHRLSVADDIAAVCGLLQSAQPDKIRLSGRVIDLTTMIRSLDVGQAVISSASGTTPRLIVGTIRPRVVAHGGGSF